MEKSEEIVRARQSETISEPVTSLNTTQARQGETSGHVRIVLASALALAFVAFILVYGLGTG